MGDREMEREDIDSGGGARSCDVHYVFSVESDIQQEYLTLSPFEQRAYRVGYADWAYQLLMQRGYLATSALQWRMSRVSVRGSQYWSGMDEPEWIADIPRHVLMYGYKIADIWFDGHVLYLSV